MCLIFDPVVTQKFLESDQKEISVYKIVDVDKFLKRIHSPYYYYTWRPGLNYLLGPFGFEKFSSAKVIKWGFHAYTSVEVCRKNICRMNVHYADNFCMELKVKAEDVIALGTRGDITFGKCFLHDSEFERLVT